MFSILEPKAVITPHGDPFKGCLRYHLGFQCPGAQGGGATIKVDGKPYSWTNGDDVLFDEVENPTDETRPGPRRSTTGSARSWAP